MTNSRLKDNKSYDTMITRISERRHGRGCTMGNEYIIWERLQVDVVGRQTAKRYKWGWRGGAEAFSRKS